MHEPRPNASSIVHRDDTWPIQITNIYGTHHPEELVSQAFAKWSRALRRGPHVLIVDMTHGNMGATAKDRERIVEWVTQNQADLEARQLVNILVVDSALVRGIITAISWLKPPVNPQYTARDMNEAVDHAAKVLKAAGVPIEADSLASARNAGSRAA